MRHDQLSEEEVRAYILDLREGRCHHPEGSRRQKFLR